MKDLNESISRLGFARVGWGRVAVAAAAQARVGNFGRGYLGVREQRRGKREITRIVPHPQGGSSQGR